MLHSALFTRFSFLDGDEFVYLFRRAYVLLLIRICLITDFFTGFGTDNYNILASYLNTTC